MIPRPSLQMAARKLESFKCQERKIEVPHALVFFVKLWLSMELGKKNVICSKILQLLGDEELAFQKGTGSLYFWCLALDPGRLASTWGESIIDPQSQLVRTTNHASSNVATFTYLDISPLSLSWGVLILSPFEEWTMLEIHSWHPLPKDLDFGFVCFCQCDPRLDHMVSPHSSALSPQWMFQGNQYKHCTPLFPQSPICELRAWSMAFHACQCN